MFVELLGLPASGKSTIQKVCTSLVKSKGKRVANMADIDRADAKSNSIPGYVTRRAASRAIYRSEQFRKLYPKFSHVSDRIFANDLKMHSLFMTTAARYLTFRDHREQFDYFFMDEGFLHRGIQMLNYDLEKKGKFVDLFLQELPEIDALIFLEIDPEYCYERVVERLAKRSGKSVDDPTTRKRILAAHGNLEVFSRRHEFMYEVSKELEENGMNVIRIDTSRDLEATTDEVRKTLEAGLAL